jgi:hypothetical protein
MTLRLSRHLLVLVVLVSAPGAVFAQAGESPEGAREAPVRMPPPASPATPTPPPAAGIQVPTAPPPPPPAEGEPKPPERGDFDFGGQVRLPSGPDEDGQYATFNWIAVDLKGRYFLLDSVAVNAVAPLAVKKPGTLAGGVEPSVFGGFDLSLEARLPRLPFQPSGNKTEVGLSLSAGFMREGAMLLSDKDFPLFVGDFQPGWTAGLIAKVQLSSVLDFSLLPVFVYQSGSVESLTAVQVPMALILRAGSFLELSADVGVYTGDDYSLKSLDGGRVALGGSLSVKICSLRFHAGAGAASLLTGGMYPTVGDSFYVDLNVKYVK